MATFVLVHGAWHGGWCWRKLTPLLHAAGHAVYAPTLTGLGERAHLLHPDIGAETHAQDILGLLEHEELSDVILVGHSLGGVTVSLVADRAPERLTHLVYLDATVPVNGMSDIALHAREQVAEWERFPRVPGNGVTPPRLAHPFGVTDEDDARWVNAHLTPHPERAFTDPIALAHPDAFAGRRTYILCTAARPSISARRVRAEPGWDFRELGTGHDAMIAAPRELCVLLLGAVPT